MLLPPPQSSASEWWLSAHRRLRTKQSSVFDYSVLGLEVAGDKYSIGLMFHSPNLVCMFFFCFFLILHFYFKGIKVNNQNKKKKKKCLSPFLLILPSLHSCSGRPAENYLQAYFCAAINSKGWWAEKTSGYLGGGVCPERVHVKLYSQLRTCTY